MTEILFVTALAVVAIYDIKKKEIPDRYVLFIVLLAVLDALTSAEWSFTSRLLGAVCVSVPLLCIAVAVKGAFGGGDVKLMAAGGLFLGWRLILTSAALAFLAAGGYVAVLLCLKCVTKKTEIAFGPFLCMGMLISLLWGEEIVLWYIQ